MNTNFQKLSNARPGDIPVISYDRLMNTGPVLDIILPRVHSIVKMNDYPLLLHVVVRPCLVYYVTHVGLYCVAGTAY